jgi:hypothetical protein
MATHSPAHDFVRQLERDYDAAVASGEVNGLDQDEAHRRAFEAVKGKAQP